MERLMLLDGNGLIYRGYFALPPLTTSKGELVNAVFGFCSIVLRGFQDIRPDYVAVAFDLSGPTFRHERFADYKATRQRMPDDLRDQFPKVREVVKALRIPVYELAGYEADDVIGTLTVQAEARGLDTTIVTGDLDMLQLVTDRTRLMTTRSGVQNTIIYDPDRIAERYGLEPAQMIDFKALKGDATDNIPGVPGVGEKTAAKLIQTFGSLETVFEQIDAVAPEKLRGPLLEARERVLESRELMTIVRDLPVELDLEAARLGEYDREGVIRLFREYEFRTLIERLPALSGERVEETVEALRTADAGEPIRAAQVAGRPTGWGPAPAGGARGGARPPGGSLVGEGTGLQLSLDFGAVEAAGAGGDGAAAAAGARAAQAATGPVEPTADLPTALAAAIADPGGRIELAGGDGIDTLEPWLAAQPAVGVALVLDDPRPLAGTALALAIAGPDGRTVAVAGPEDAARLRRLVERIDVPLVGHEVKPLLVARLAEDPAARPMAVAFDTQIAAYILNASLRSQTIADVVAEQLDLILPPAAELPPFARAGLEALSAIAVRDPLVAALEREGLEQLFREIELPLIPVLARMEAVGVALDRDGAGGARRRVRRGDRAAGTGDLRQRRPRVQPRQPEAARAGPVLRARPAQGQADEDGLLDRRVGPRGAPGGPPDGRRPARVADVHQAPLDLRRGAPDPDRLRWPAPHHVPPGRRRDRPAVVVRPEPPEHPDPDGARTADPPGVRGGRPGGDPGRRRLLPDRAPDPGPRVG